MGRDDMARLERASISVSEEVARRYLLGRQGLWPGRRWTGKKGAERAIRALQALQLDPVTVVARSQDLVLWSRVKGYHPGQLDQLLYGERRFFDYGGHLDVFPMEELPYWRLHMRRRRRGPSELAFAAANRPLLRRVLAAVTDQGPLLPSQLERRPVPGGWGRGSSDVAEALYHLWLVGDLMTHSREGFRRRYELSQRVASPELLQAAPPGQAAAHFGTQVLRRWGLASVSSWRRSLEAALLNRTDPEASVRLLERMVAAGAAQPVLVGDGPKLYLCPGDELPLLETLAEGSLPAAWRGAATTSDEEVNLLSPLDNLLLRERTRELFGFDFLWEIYKPAPLRRWGMYTLPVLYGDRLVARLEPRLDRREGALRVLQLWFEEDFQGRREGAFLEALGRGLASLASFHGAHLVDVSELGPGSWRGRLRASIRRHGMATI